MYHGYSDQNHGDLFENDQGMNRSYNSGISSVSPNNASASSSKAVLAALRALQDKIRRLESERAQALDETAQLRHQIKNQEIEAEHIKQRDSLTAQKNLHEVRSAYERILTEKTETEIRLSKLEDRNRQEQQIAADLRSKILSAEEEKHSTLLTIKDLEAERTQLQSQIAHIQQKEKDLGQTILWETKRHEEDMDVLSTKLRALQNELSNVVHEKSVVETKLVELDQLVGQLLLVNESLVVRLSGKPLQQLKPKMKTKKRTTQSQTMGRPSSAVPQKPQSRPISLKAVDDVKNLQNMHKMYVDMAHNITDSRRGTGGEGGGGEGLRSSSAGPLRPSGTESFRRSEVYENDRYNTSEGIIGALELEFSKLNEEYRSLLSAVQGPALSPGIETIQAEGLVKVIAKLHKKGEQIRALKSPLK